MTNEQKRRFKGISSDLETAMWLYTSQQAVHFPVSNRKLLAHRLMLSNEDIMREVRCSLFSASWWLYDHQPQKTWLCHY